MFESEVLTTAKLNKIKQDTILKNFWKNNDRFADLFNTFLFNGEEILKPDDITEVDTDVSSMLKFNGHAETVQKILDVVKKKETLLLRMNFYQNTSILISRPLSRTWTRMYQDRKSTRLNSSH